MSLLTQKRPAKKKIVKLNKKIAARIYIKPPTWNLACMYWDQSGMNKSVGAERLIEILCSEKLDTAEKATGQSRMEILSRLVEWFSGQKTDTQFSILVPQK